MLQTINQFVFPAHAMSFSSLEMKEKVKENYYRFLEIKEKYAIIWKKRKKKVELGIIFPKGYTKGRINTIK